MDLLGLLGSATTALNAQQFGLEVTGQNIANLNTQGYARRSAVLVSQPDSSGGGVLATGVSAARDSFIEGRLRDESSPEAQDGAIVDALTVVQTSLGQAGSSIDGSLSSFFDAFSALSATPQSTVARDNVVLQGKQVATSFNDMAARLDSSRTAADRSIRDTVDQVNQLASQIAGLNAQIGSANGADVESLKDKQGVALQQLAALTPVTVVANANGGVDVSVGAGRALVVGGNQYALGVSSTSPSGFAAITAGGVDITSELSGGKIGGLLQVRDTLVPGYMASLDQLAYDFATSVNTAHKAGYDANGNTGNLFFTQPATVAGAAAALQVDPALAADSSRIAASSTGAAGDNQTASAIAQLRDASATGGGTDTFVQAWGQIVYQVGTDAQAAQTDQQSRQDVISAVQQLRDSVSGVSLDQEAGQMLQYQRAYQANAKYFSTVNSMLDTLLTMVGR